MVIELREFTTPAVADASASPHRLRRGGDLHRRNLDPFDQGTAGGLFPDGQQ